MSIVQFTSVPAGKFSVTLSLVAIVSLLLVVVTTKAISDPALALATSAVLLIETFGGTVGVGVGVANGEAARTMVRVIGVEVEKVSDHTVTAFRGRKSACSLAGLSSWSSG